MDIAKIDGLLAQMKTVAALAVNDKGDSSGAVNHIEADFAKTLKAAMDHVNAAQQEAGHLSKQFELGAPNVALQDVVIAIQKANISFQTMIQVRNKLVSTYHDIMNMQM